MARKFVVRFAHENCQYGDHFGILWPAVDRHISVEGLLFANESDIDPINVSTRFGTCRSPYRVDYSLESRDAVGSAEELQAYGVFPSCEYEGGIPWQNVNETVHFGLKYDLGESGDPNRKKKLKKGNLKEKKSPKERQVQCGFRQGDCALMENGWTICLAGLGIISLTDSGQPEEDPVQTILARLEELEKLVDAYMKENGIAADQREGLLQSVLLWNGYQGSDISWDYQSDSTKRDFCTYLMKENPSLYNYFERGIYVQDPGGERIDLSYMLGSYTALNQTKDAWECVSQTMLYDRGMYNGYLEACRQETGKGSGKVLRDFLKGLSDPEYDGQSRYEEYLRTTEQAMRDSYCEIHSPGGSGSLEEITQGMRKLYCEMHGLEPGSLSGKEQDTGYMKDFIAESVTSHMYGVTWEDREEQARAIAESFIQRLQNDR